MFAIVDIETTGGHAGSNGITEIAIGIHDGERLVEVYETLINPLVPVPRFIQSLTGITNAMVSQAPVFEEVAAIIYNLLRNKVFVAHNVNFDYSFVNHKLAAAGYHLDTEKLCTIRMARKILPGHQRYGLGKLCRSLDIPMDNRHRAGGDMMATVKLFEMLIANDAENEIKKMLKTGSKEKYLPPNLPVDKVAELPTVPGVYYFHNSKGKIVYVGKAKDLKKRVTSHFSNNKTGRQKQDFLREVHNITYKECGSELIAFIFESIEIKRLWPLYNRSLKGFQQMYALYCYEDSKGYERLVIEKKKKQLIPLYTFNLLLEGMNVLKQLVTDFELCPRLCFIDKTPGETMADMLTAKAYNERVRQAIEHLNATLPTFAVVEEMLVPKESKPNAIILMEKGRFYGMGYGPANVSWSQAEQVKQHITAYPESDYIRGLVYQYVSKHPGRKVEL